MRGRSPAGPGAGTPPAGGGSVAESAPPSGGGATVHRSAAGAGASPWSGSVLVSSGGPGMVVSPRVVKVESLSQGRGPDQGNLSSPGGERDCARSAGRSGG